MTTPKTIYDDVLIFSAKQPLWVQDALRRIVSAGGLRGTDLDQAVTLCKAAHGLSPVAPAPTPTPLASTHLPSPSGSAMADVTLTALHDLEHVNALLPRQRLQLEPSGISVVYGENGTGKSGYARVLKRLCRARGSLAPILPNVFDKGAGRPRASIEFTVGGTTQTWTGELDPAATPAPSELAQVCVYDGLAGAHTVAEKQEVTLLPPGLDVLPQLKDVLDHVAAELKRDEAADTAPALPTLHEGTAAARFVQSVSSATSASELDQACVWSADDEAEREKATARVAELRAADPKALAAKARKRAERLDAWGTALARVNEALGGDVDGRVDRGLAELHDARTAQSLQRGEALPSDALPGTGGSAWKALWEAARDYSEREAYAGRKFPHVEHDARCVLCQQELGEAAGAHMRSFEDYVQGALSKRAEAAALALAQLRENIARAIEPGLAEGRSLDELDDIAGVDGAALRAYVEAAIVRRDALLSIIDGGTRVGEVTPLADAPHAQLQAAAAQYRARADELDASPAGHAMKEALSTLHELEARKALHGARAQIEAELGRLRRAELRKSALKECNTAAVSKALSELTEKHVTTALAEAFNRELHRLGGGHLSVQLEKAGTSKATTYTALKLVDADHKQALVPSVFSEGEQRAVSLAWFFAELGLSPSRSAIVFDDPVSSMDHEWRRKVAKRLVAEAKQRQVVVFTHDVVLLHTLTDEGTHGASSPHGVHLQRRGGKPGWCTEGLPWDARNVGDRVGALKELHVRLKKTKETGTDEEYTQAVASYLDKLRKTWERAVEECLLNGAVQRFGEPVQTKRLGKVDLVAGDYEAIERGMKACNPGVHDQASPLQGRPPSPEEIAGILNDLIAWVGALRDRRKGQNLPKLTPIDV